jgi:hypothetical protein
MGENKIQRIGLDTLPVTFVDTSDTSPNYFDVVYLPPRFTAGKNLIKLKGNSATLLSKADVFVEVLDAIDNPLNFEVLDYQDDDGTVCIQVEVDEETAPGNCTIYIATRAINIPELGLSNIPSAPGSNIKWKRVLPVSPGTLNNNEILFVSGSLPKIDIRESISPYFDQSYKQDRLMDVSTISTVKLIVPGTTKKSVSRSTTTTGQNRVGPNYLYKVIQPNPLVAANRGNAISTLPIVIQDNTLPTLKITSGDFIFSSSMIGGAITVNNPIIDTTTGLTASNTTYNSIIVNVLNETTAHVADDLQFVYRGRGIREFDSTPFSCSYIDTPIYTPSENFQSYIDVDIHNILPSTGNVYKIRAYMRPVGAAGEYRMVNETILTQQDILVDTGSATGENKIGEFVSLPDITTYWSSSVSGLYNLFPVYDSNYNRKATDLKVTYSRNTLNDAMQLDSLASYTEGDFAVIKLRDAYFPKFYKDDKYVVALNASVISDSIFKTSRAPSTQKRVPDGWVDVYMSGSAFDSNVTLTADNIQTNLLGKYIGSVYINNGAILLDKAFEFEADQDGTGTVLFAVRSGNVYLSNIHVYPDSTIGRSPSRIRMKLPIDTISINAELQFKFQYFDYQGNPADYETEVFGPVFAGGNTYIEGDQNVLTGSLSVGGGIGKGFDIVGDLDYAWSGLHGYDGFDNAVSGSGDPGIATWSGSTTIGNTNYIGVGFELTSDRSWLDFRAGGGQEPHLNIMADTITYRQLFLSGSTQPLTGSYWTGSVTDPAITRLSDVKITGSLYVTGSSNFIGNQNVSGSVSVQGTFRLDPTQDPGSTFLSSSFLFVSKSNTSLGYDMYVRQDGNLVKWKWVEGNLNTGILYGGVLTYSGSTFYISPGTGIIVNHNATTGSEVNPQVQYVSWNATTQSITSTTDQNTYVYIDAAGTAHQQTSFFTTQQYHTVLPIGRVSHYGAGSTTITGVGNNLVTAYDQVSQQTEFARAFGPLKLNGFGITPQPGTLGYSLASGVAFNLGGFYQFTPGSPSTYTSNAYATSSIIRIYRSGSGYQFDNNAGAYYTAIDPAQWDDGTGTLAAVGNSEWTIQRVFVNPVSGRSHIYYGQNTPYTTLQNALQGLSTDSFTESDVTINAYVLAAYLIVRGNTADLSNTVDNSIINAGLFRNTSGGGGGGGAATTLDDLTDVNITTPANGQTIIYNAGLWVNGYSSTASYSVTASHALSGNGTFSGSFLGNGSNLTDIPVTALVGYDPSRIYSGSATASISPNLGLQINTNTTISGSLYVTGTGSIGATRAVIGVAPLTSSLTVWDGKYTTPNPLAALQGMSATDSALVSIVNNKPYGGVSDDDYIQLLNHLTVSATSSDDETITLQRNYLDLSFANTQSNAITNIENTALIRSGSRATVVYSAVNTTQVSESGYVTSAVGSWNETLSTGATIVSAFGSYSRTLANLSGSINTAYGHYIINGANNWGRYGNVYGLYLTNNIVTNATMSNYAGVTVAGIGTGSIGNALVLLGTGTIPSGSWAIYNTSSFQNYFRGWVGINKTIPTTNLDIIGDVYVTGSIRVTAGVTASLQGTASYANEALTASFAATASYVLSSSYAISSSYSLNATTASYTVSSSYALNASTASFTISSSFAATASYVLNAVSSSFSTTASYYAETDPVFTAQSGSLVTTSSFNAFTSSYNTGSFTGSFIGNGVAIVGVISSSYSVTASYAATALSSSYAATASLATSGNGVFSGSFSGSFQGNGSKLTDIPVTALTGFDPSRIVSGSVTASVSPAAGFVVNARATITGSLSNGDDAVASGTFSHAEGQHTLASDNAAHSEGYYATASGQYSHAEGASTRAIGIGSHAEGQTTIASNDYSHAEGVNTLASGFGSHAEGYKATSSGNYSHAEGDSTQTIGVYSHAEGYGTYAFGQYAHAEGYLVSASGNYSHAEGSRTFAYYLASHAEGFMTTASAAYSHAEGRGTLTTGSYSHAEGYYTIASGSYAHAEGENTLAMGNSSHAEGYQTTASGLHTHAEGGFTVAVGQWSHAEGYQTTAIGTGAHSNGLQTTASGNYSYTIGNATIASGQYSNAEGSRTVALGNWSHAEGNTSIASGSYAHAEGSNTTATGPFAHSEGSLTIAYGTGSHAEGYGTQTAPNASYSHAEGRETVASGSYQHVGGQWNTHGDTTSLFIIGNGSSAAARSDIFKISTTTAQLNGILIVSGSAIVTGSVSVTQNISASRAILSGSEGTISGSTLTVIGSGSAQPIFTVQGSNGELFSVTDSLSGSLFSVNNISGLPILEVFSDDTIMMGSYLAPALNTTKRQILAVGNNVIYSIPTASYDAAWFEYSVRSGSSARAGSIMAIWSGSSVNFTETTTTDFGNTAGVNFTVIVTGSNFALTGSATTAAWTLKTIIRSI